MIEAVIMHNDSFDVLLACAQADIPGPVIVEACDSISHCHAYTAGDGAADAFEAWQGRTAGLIRAYGEIG